MNSHDSSYVTERDPPHFQNIDIRDRGPSQDGETRLPFLESVDQAVKCHFKNETRKMMEINMNSGSNSEYDFGNAHIKGSSDGRVSETAKSDIKIRTISRKES